MSVLFVCTGNINRSAAAHWIAATAGFDAESAGTSTHARTGQPMNRRMREQCSRAGLGIPRHRSRWLGDVDVRRFDLVVGFQPSHIAAVEAQGAHAKSILDLVAWKDWTKVPDPQFDSALFGPVFEYLLHAVPLVVT